MCYKYRFGNTGKIEEKKAEEYCLKSCLNGSKFALGMQNLFGWQTEKNEKKAFEIFTEIVENDPNCETKIIKNSLFLLGRCYNNGEGCTKNLIKAMTYYEKSIALGNINAMYNLALVNEFGEGIPKNIRLAMELYEKASNFNHLKAINNLSIIYYKGNEKEGIQINVEKSLELIERAVEQEFPLSMSNLAFLIKDGNEKLGIKKDFNRAIQLYHRASELNYADAMNSLAIIYKNGDKKNGFKKDVFKAIELYERAIKLGELKALYNLAIIYEKGDVDCKIEPDFIKCCSLLYQRFSSDDDKASKRRFLYLIEKEQKNLVWRTDYHIYWKKDINLNKKINLILLISKNRNVLSKDNSLIKHVFVKGISFEIIKYLCHFSPCETMKEDEKIPPPQKTPNNTPNNQKNCIIF